MRLPTPARRKTFRAREFRQEPTESEAKAWEILRHRQVHGLKFKRQKVVDGFIVDFYCADPPIAVEIDGGVHDEPGVAAADAEKDRALASRGIRVVRVRNHAVTKERLTAAIGRALAP